MADRQLNFLAAANILVIATPARVPEFGLLSLGVMPAMISGNGGTDL
ncbi:hypothetical protein ACCS93_33435 [Rhizobium ruizarguesonis]